LSSHILPEVSQLCQRVIIINRGQIVAGDTPENLSRQLGRGVRLALRVRGPELEVEAALQAVPGVLQVSAQGEGRYLVAAGNGQEEDLSPQLARQVVGQGWELMELKAQDVTLEDVFLNLVTEEET
jgi:ABC-2 type transport system ATP-binding protein